jgi:hypothetical protein
MEESQKGETGMLRCASLIRVFLAVIVPLAGLIVTGCAPTINHLYDRSTNFSTLRSYAWAPGASIQWPSGLVEANVRSLADSLLESRGFARATAKADFVIAVELENYPIGSQGGYALRTLSLNMYVPDGRVLIWRGTASGSISTDAASDDLRSTVQSLLAAFPPR